jgi:hypothetical protein
MGMITIDAISPAKVTIIGMKTPSFALNPVSKTAWLCSELQKYRSVKCLRMRTVSELKSRVAKAAANPIGRKRFNTPVTQKNNLYG